MIDIVTLSCNEDPMYWEFWNPISKHWKQEFGIHPVLFYYGSANPSLSEENGTIVYHDVIDDIPDYVAATWGRFWVTKFFPQKMCLISDIDMFPLSRGFFLEKSNSQVDVYTHLNADAYHVGNFECWKDDGVTVPVCYHLATSEMLNSVYGFSDTFHDEIQKLLSRNYTEYRSGFASTSEAHLQKASADHGGMWGIDEMYSSSLLREYFRAGGVVSVGQRVLPQNRLCRSRIGSQLSTFSAGTHIDFHSVRPYNTYKHDIQQLLKRGTA
jgi:hypothetical protein